MPGQHCPACGAVSRPGGCACSPHPDFEETAVLPVLDGPELVRPYVPAATTELPVQDEFPTTLIPPQAPYDSPTALIPPQAPYDSPTKLIPPQAPPYHQQPYRQVTPPQPPARELGVFEVQQPASGGRAQQRVRERQGSPGRRRAAILAAGAGIAAVGAGLALVLSPGSDGGHHTDVAVPLPVSTYEPTLPAASASAVPPPPSPTPSPSHPKPSHKSTASRTPSPTSSPSATETSSPSRTPSATPSTSTPTPSASTATPRTLQRGDSGADVQAMQQKLASVLCYDNMPTDGWYGRPTARDVSDFQWQAGVQGDAPGVYGPNTRAALEQTQPNC